ncbi:MAG: RNA polymerase sigma factor [Bacteriovoracaceae bacterium]|nr:RNA polymerase sigma factor [Bacteriovoracaceae bacterium]
MINLLKQSLSIQPARDSQELVDEFKDHYIQHNEFIRASIYWMVRSEIVDDLVQDTFVKALNSYSKFKGDSSFKTWIYRIARNVTYDYLRKNGKGQFQEIEDGDLVHSDKEDVKDLISQGLVGLGPKHREVFVLHFKFGHTFNEIAGLLDITEGTVKSRVFYAKKKFSEFLKDNEVTNG